MDISFEDRRKIDFFNRFKKDAEITTKQSNVLKGYPINEMTNFFKYDIGRWVLVNPRLGLNEQVDRETQPITLSISDQILLSFFLKAFQLTNDKDEIRKIAFKVPLESYGFSLMCGFFTLIHHGLELGFRDISINARFQEGRGVLLISDNNELGVRLLDTRYGDLALTQVYPTYKLKNNGEFRKWCDIQPKEFTMPWFAFFKAYFQSLPDMCELLPHITIIDLMPFKHRDKLETLIKWAQDVAKSKLILIVSPVGYSDADKILDKYRFDIISADSYFGKEVTKGFQVSSIKHKYAHTRCWSINDSIKADKVINIFTIKECKEIENRVVKILELINSAEHKTEGLSRVFYRLKAVTFDLLNMIVPLYWFERERELQKKNTLKNLIERAAKSVPTTEHETRVFNNTLPVVVKELLSLYSVIEGFEETPKGCCLLNELYSCIRSDIARVLILVSDNITKAILQQWIKFKMNSTIGTKFDFKILTLNEYHRNKLCGNDLELLNRLIINFGWWQKKYYDLFFDDNSVEITFITFEIEGNIVKKQIHSINSVVERAYDDRIKALNNVFCNQNIKFATDINKDFLPKIKVNEKYLKYSSPLIISKDKMLESKQVNLDIDTLINLMQKSFDKNSTENGIEFLENSLFDYSIEEQIEYYGGQLGNSSIGCFKVLTYDDHIMFLEKYSDYKIFKVDKQKLVDIPSIQIYPKDYLVRLKSGERKDIFNHLLESVARTPVMLYINSRLNQWFDMVERLREKHKSNSYSSVNIYERMLCDLRSNGCNIIRHETIRNWVRGWSKIIDYKNLVSVAVSIGDEEALKNCYHIDIAMKKLLGIHIELGKILSKVIYKHVTKALDGDSIESSEVVIIQGGIKIPLSDIIDSIEIIKIKSIDKSIEYSVPYWLVGKLISKTQYEKLSLQKIINVVREANNG